MSGSVLTRSEVIGDIKVKMKKVPEERRFDPLEPHARIVSLKRIPVLDGENEEEALEQVKEVYTRFTGKELKGKALPKKIESGKHAGFYHCSTTGKKEVLTEPHKFRKIVDNWKKTSNFALKKGQYRYARVYVVYDDIGNNSDYMWFIRMMEIEDTEEIDRFWESQEDR